MLMKILVCLSVHDGIVIGLSANGKFVVGIVGALERRELACRLIDSQ